MSTTRTAIVTGGTRGIGLAIARSLLAQGLNVAITGTRSDTVESGVRALRDVAPDRLTGHVLNVRKYADVERTVGDVVSRYGGLDILVNNAGVGLFRPVADMSVEEWHNVVDTNLTGVFYCCRAALPHLKAQGASWIINISSLAGKNAFPEGAAYCASKSGLNAFSESLMQEVRHDGVRVAYVMPGSVSTDFGGDGRSLAKSDWALQPDDIAQVVWDLVSHPARSLPSRVEIRPARPPKKG